MKFSAEQHYKIAKRLNDRAAAETDPARKTVLRQRANRFLALVRVANLRASMLTPDKIDALRRKSRETQDFARKWFAKRGVQDG